jgi:hypothetical protein
LRFSIFIVLAVFGACEHPAVEPEPVPSEPPPSEPVVHEQPTPEEPPLPPLSAECEQAMRCCHAFVDVMPDNAIVENTACAGPREAEATENPTRRCRMLTAGWRLTIERIDPERVSACD